MILCYYVVRIVKQKVSHSVNAKTRQCAPMLTETFLAAMRRHAKHAHVSRATLGESRETAWRLRPARVPCDGWGSAAPRTEPRTNTHDTRGPDTRSSCSVVP